MFYYYPQNNPGGYYGNPAHTVIIEADSEKEADAKFNSIDEIEYGYCECCGGAWNGALDESETLVTSKIRSNWDDPDIPMYKIYFADGSTRQVD